MGYCGPRTCGNSLEKLCYVYVIMNDLRTNAHWCQVIRDWYRDTRLTLTTDFFPILERFVIVECRRLLALTKLLVFCGNMSKLLQQ